MSYGSSRVSVEEEVEVIYQTVEVESLDEPPQEEWSSLTCLENYNLSGIGEKERLFQEGLYEPGSGEICTKYLALSDSDVLGHPYYAYPRVVDPGISAALQLPQPEVIYGSDGQELYLNICKEMNQCPIRSFHRQLLEPYVNLRYYGINSSGMRPIAMALKENTYVQVLDLRDNWINEDGCYHLGEMLGCNLTLRDLILYGCRIGPVGAANLCRYLHTNPVLNKLDLSRNQLNDDGVEYIAKAIAKRSNIHELYISYNNLTSKALTDLSESLERNNKLTHVDLSWNSLLSPKSLEAFCSVLAGNVNLTEVDLSWTSLTFRFARGIVYLLDNPNIRTLKLNNNQLNGGAVTTIARNLPKAKKLEYLDLSSNPTSAKAAFLLLSHLKVRKIKLMTLLLDNVYVNPDFIELRNEILSLKFRKGAIITHGEVKPTFVIEGADVRELVLNRAVVVCSKPKNRAVDIPIMILTFCKSYKGIMELKDFSRLLKHYGAAQINEELIEEIVTAFAGPKRGKILTINMDHLAEYVKRKWPDAKLPPTPPPEPEPEPSKKKRKGKGKKK